ERALDAARERCRGGEALLAMGHCHMAGAALRETDSERPVLRGGEEAVPTAIFGRDVAYVALGHLHLAQPVGSERVRYCGSPIPLSMGEAGYTHQVLVADFDGATLRSVRSRIVPRSVPVRRFEGALEEVVGEIAASDLPDAEAPAEEHAFVDVRLTDLAPRARDRVREALAPFGARLVAVRIDAPIRQMVGPSTVSSESGLQTFEPEQVFAALHERRRGGPPEEALVTCFRELLREAENRESTPA
ncbi:MAG TPA: exonuclease SbcCD subunit D C-terminal domain-containing protein, partial [Polyangiaceae bacterium LLY-WYZ-15_(1-7)]|nr:exonuclease SbcCD subunit D C-terminal domain-containing protein [Polyangiaceae bacterium LLY-WYZ-15_(1-7)]